MEGSTEKGLHSFATILVALAIIGILVGIIWKVMPIIQKGSSKIDNYAVQMENVEYDAYNGTEVSGSEVISAINTKSSANITVTVKTIGGEVPYNGGTYQIKDIADKNYIEPTARFDAKVERTGNKTVTGITFTQK